METLDPIKWNLVDSKKIANESKQRIESLLAEKYHSSIIPSEWTAVTMLDTKSFLESFNSKWELPVQTISGSIEDLKNCLGISYRWGAAGSHVSLTGYVNRTARLNCNIDALIRTIKRCKMPYFWLDSLCIDQTEQAIHSRLAEVSRMRLYYQNFGLVTILGSYSVSMEDTVDLPLDDEDPIYEEVAKELAANNYTANGWHERAWTTQESGVAKVIEWCGFKGPQEEFRLCTMRVCTLIGGILQDDKGQEMIDQIIYLGNGIVSSWEAASASSEAWNAVNVINERHALFPEDVISALCPLVFESFVGKEPHIQWEELYPNIVNMVIDDLKESFQPDDDDPNVIEPALSYVKEYLFCYDKPNGSDPALWCIGNTKLRDWIGRPYEFNVLMKGEETEPKVGEIYNCYVPLSVDGYNIVVSLELEFDGFHYTNTNVAKFLKEFLPKYHNEGSWKKS